MRNASSIFLRPINDNDLQIMLLWENNPENWQYSDYSGPYTLKEIETFIIQSDNVRENKQLRLMICLSTTHQPVGAVDLFAINFNQKKAGVGILIADEKDRKKGYAKAALESIEEYCSEEFQLKELNCEIQANNLSSIRLFETLGYNKIESKTIRKKYQNSEIDVYFYQKFLLKKNEIKPY